MKRLSFIFCFALAGCASEAPKAEQAAEQQVAAGNLAGGLPSQVTLSCNGDEPRQYRIYFSNGIWDWKRSIGGWSAYSGIAAVTDTEIVLADGRYGWSPEHYSLKLNRTDLNLIEFRSGPTQGMTVPPRPAHFECVIAETKNV